MATLSKAARAYFVEQGRKGGKASKDGRMAKLSPERRSAIARHAINTRWARVRAAKALGDAT